MNRDLRQLLRGADGGPVEPVDLTMIERRSGRLRTGRRVRLAAGLAALIGTTALVVVGIGLTRGPQVEVVGVPPTQETTVVDGIVVDVAPPLAEMDRLDQVETALPTKLRLEPEDVRPLSEAPVRQALALFRKVHRTGDRAADVFVIGSDGQPRVIDLANFRLAGDVDAESIHTVEVLSTTLSPDGTRAAFVHRNDQTADGVLVVDLTSAEAHRIPLPTPVGYFARVIWRPDGQHIVVEDHEGDQTMLVTVTTGHVSRVPHHDPLHPYGGLGVVAMAPPGDDDTVRLTGGSIDEDAALRRWTSDGVPVANHRLPETGLAPHGWDWGTPGWRHGTLVARTHRGGPAPEEGTVVVVIDLESGEFVRALHLGAYEVSTTGRAIYTGRGGDGSPVLGWLDEDTVLLADRGVVAWNIRTGRLYLVAQLQEGPGGTPIGYDAVGNLHR